MELTQIAVGIVVEMTADYLQDGQRHDRRPGRHCEQEDTPGEGVVEIPMEVFREAIRALG